MLAKKAFSSTLAVLLLTFTSSVQAQEQPEIAQRTYQTDKCGACYVINYNALITNSLESAIAQTYGIRRSKKRAMLNVSVRKQLPVSESESTGCQEGQLLQTQAVKAAVTAKATNLVGLSETLDMRIIEEGDADSKGIYYIDDFRISNNERWKFTITVNPEEQCKEPLEIEFHQRFFVD